MVAGSINRTYSIFYMLCPGCLFWWT